jgi:hypothetical protein
MSDASRYRNVEKAAFECEGADRASVAEDNGQFDVVHLA